MPQPTLQIDTWCLPAAKLLGEHVGDGWDVQPTPLPFTQDGLYLHPSVDDTVRRHAVAAYPALATFTDPRAPEQGAAVRLQALKDGPRLNVRKVGLGSVRRARQVLDALAPVVKSPSSAIMRFDAQTDGSLRYGAATAEQRVALAALLGLEPGVSLQVEQPWSPSDCDIDLGIPKPLGASLVTESPVLIEIDAPNPEALELAETLRSRGFPHVEVALRVGLDRFTIWPGALTAASPLEGIAPLTQAVNDFLGTLKVDPARTPLETWKPDYDEPFATLVTRIQLPLARYRAGTLQTYIEGSCESYAITLRTNQAARCAPLVESLSASGFRVSVTDLPGEAIEPSLTMRRLARDVGPLGELTTALRAAGHGLQVATGPELGERDVEIVLPIDLSRSEVKRRVKRTCARFNVVLHAPEARRRDLRQAAELLRAKGFRRVRIRHRPVPPGAGGCLTFGAAPPQVLDRIEQALRVRVGSWERERRFASRDHDIFVQLPASEADEEEASPIPTHDPFATWIRGGALSAPSRAFLQHEEAGTRVGRHLLRRGPICTGGEDGSPDWVIDGSTGETLQVVARAVADRVPVLLEGPTATSKSSTVVWLAHQLGYPVVRVNLSAHADTAELLGRYMPTPAGWRWSDGSVVRALRAGAWLVLDELNLADPAVVERLNPLLEDTPSLRLTEHDGEVFGPGGTPIHPDFRIFATANPATYGGRRSMSPALRDRFILHHQPGVPSEEDLEAMLRSLMLGKETPITVGGQRYAVEARAARHPLGLDLTLADRLVVQLARLWSGLIRLGDQPDVFGQGTAPIYTRRGLIALTRGLARGLQSGRPLDLILRQELLAHVVARAGRTEDRVAVARLLDATGLGPNTWCPCHGAAQVVAEPEQMSLDTLFRGA